MHPRVRVHVHIILVHMMIMIDFMIEYESMSALPICFFFLLIPIVSCIVLGPTGSKPRANAWIAAAEDNNIDRY